MPQSEFTNRLERSLPMLGLGSAFVVLFIYSTITELVPHLLSDRILLTLSLALILTLINFRIWIGGLVLIAVLWLMFSNEQPQPDERLHVIWVSWRVMIDLAFLLITCRLNLFGKQLGLNWKNRGQIVSALQQVMRSDSPGNQEFSLESVSHFWVIARRRILLPVLVTVGLMLIVAPGRQTISEYRLTPGGFRAIQIGLILSVSFLLIATVLNAWTWRKSSAAECWIYLRSVTINWLNPDLRGVAKRRAKKRIATSKNAQQLKE